MESQMPIEVEDESAEMTDRLQTLASMIFFSEGLATCAAAVALLNRHDRYFREIHAEHKAAINRLRSELSEARTRIAELDDGGYNAQRAALADALDELLIHDINGDVSGMYRASDKAIEAIVNAVRHLRGTTP